MTFDEIRSNLIANAYEHSPTAEEKEILDRRTYTGNSVIDENQTVKWNREEGNRRDDEKKATQSAVCEKRNSTRNLFYAHVEEAIRDDLGNLSIKDVSTLISKAFDKDGYADILSEAESLTSMVRNLF